MERNSGNKDLFEKAKEEIEAIQKTRQALVLEARQRIRQEEHQKKQQKKLRVTLNAEAKAREKENLAIVRKMAPQLLREANQTIFENKGRIKGWRKIKIIEREKYGSRPLDADGWRSENVYRLHRTTYLATTLQLPNGNNISIAIPTKTQWSFLPEGNPFKYLLWQKAEAHPAKNKQLEVLIHYPFNVLQSGERPHPELIKHIPLGGDVVKILEVLRYNVAEAATRSV